MSFFPAHIHSEMPRFMVTISSFEGLKCGDQIFPSALWICQFLEFSILRAEGNFPDNNHALGVCSLVARPVRARFTPFP